MAVAFGGWSVPDLTDLPVTPTEWTQTVVAKATLFARDPSVETIIVDIADTGVLDAGAVTVLEDLDTALKGEDVAFYLRDPNDSAICLLTMLGTSLSTLGVTT